jgi:hypothetical protein
MSRQGIACLSIALVCATSSLVHFLPSRAPAASFLSVLEPGAKVLVATQDSGLIQVTLFDGILMPMEVTAVGPDFFVYRDPAGVLTRVPQTAIAAIVRMPAQSK